MGKSKSKRKSPSGRNSVPSPADDAGSSSPQERLEDAIEEERSRLMRAHNVLGCVKLAMEFDDDEDVETPYYAEIIQLARDLVNESVNRLDSVKIGPLVGALPQGK